MAVNFFHHRLEVKRTPLSALVCICISQYKLVTWLKGESIEDQRRSVAPCGSRRTFTFSTQMSESRRLSELMNIVIALFHICIAHLPFHSTPIPSATALLHGHRNPSGMGYVSFKIATKHTIWIQRAAIQDGHRETPPPTPPGRGSARLDVHAFGDRAV